MPKLTTATGANTPAKKAPAKKATPPPPTDDPSADDGIKGNVTSAPEQGSLLADTDTELGFISLDDVADYVNACFYGLEGSGKSTAAARMANIPDCKRVLVINAEGGLKKRALIKRGVDTDKIVVWPDPRRNERLTHAGLNALYLKIKKDLQDDPTSWTGVVFDSGTEITDALLNRVQERRVTALQKKGADVDEHFVDISDYGTMAKMFRDLLTKFRDLPCHFVITALERRDVDKDSGKPMYGPAVIASLQTVVTGHVDYVLKFKQADEDGPYRALTKRNGKYRAKDRLDVLPKVLPEPSFDRLLAYHVGALDPSTDSYLEDVNQAADDNVKVDADADETETATADS